MAEPTSGWTQATIRLTLAKAHREAVSYRIRTRTVDAEKGDFVAIDKRLIFAPGRRRRSIRVTIAGDARMEPAEMFQVIADSFRVRRRGRWVKPSRSGEAPRLVSLVTIAPSASPPVVPPPRAVVSITGPASVVEGPPGTRTRVELTVRLSHAASQSTRLRWQSLGPRAPGHYVGSRLRNSGTVTFGRGATESGVLLELAANDLDEPDAEFVFEVNQMASDVPPARITVTITDDDPPGTVSLGPATDGTERAAGQPASPVIVPVVLRGTNRAIDVAWEARPGPGASPEDLAATSGTLRATGAGDRIEVPVTDDALDEDLEEVSVRITSVSDASFDPAPAVGKIVDDDDPPTLVVESAEVMEGPGGGSFVVPLEVSLSAPSGKHISARATSGAGSATAGADFSPLDTTLQFPPGTVSVPLELTVLDDSILEPDEHAAVALSAVTNAGHSPGEDQGVSILDDDGPCTQDAHEPNATVATATPFAGNGMGLALCDADEDVIAITVPQGATAVRVAPAERLDAAIELLAADGSTVADADLAWWGEPEQLSLAGRATGSTVYLRVGNAGGDGAYSVSVLTS